MRRAAELDPRTVQNFTDIGETLLRLRRFEEADQAFATAQDADPDNPVTLWRLGELQLHASGDINSFSKLTHFAATLVPNAQLRAGGLLYTWMTLRPLYRMWLTGRKASWTPRISALQSPC